MDVLNIIVKQDYLNKAMLISSIVGVCIGIFTSFVVNATLVEISINTFFSLYYGIIFSAIGGFLIYRTKQQDFDENTTNDFQNRKTVVLAFAGLTILSGILSVILDKQWFATIGPHVKIPMYMVLGSSICFIIVFAGIDIINFIGGYLRRIKYRSLVDTTSQLLALSVLSLAMGAIYGLLFGWNDVEDGSEFMIQMKMMKEEKSCFVIGIFLGALGGILNELLRKNIMQQFFPKAERDPFSEEI